MEPPGQEEAVVAVINLPKRWVALAFVAGSSQASVLPVDRADVMHHSYAGGGVNIDGPAVQVRSKVGQNLSISGTYYIDTVSGASVDVVATASAYSEQRKEKHIGFDYLAGNSLLSANVTASDENDYKARTVSFDISHDTFGGLTTLSLGTALGDDTVGRNGDANFQEQVKRNNYRVGITQIITTTWIMALNGEVNLDEGFLNNPYRQVRYVDPTAPLGYAYQSEIYPRTRNAAAVSLVNKFYWSDRSAFTFNIRGYQDSWDIRSADYEVSYVKPLDWGFTVEARIRYYKQTQASFYRDLFDYQSQLNFMARDKELSDFSDLTSGVGLIYKLPAFSFFKGTAPEITLQYEEMLYKYNNFRDVRVRNVPAGTEPMYELEARVIRAFFSLYF